MQIGPYRVLRVLARGGMGEVCLASLERTGGFRKLVALKRALPEFAADPAFGAMFQREARLAAALNHRNIVQVFDFAHHADEAWLAMEYVRGVDLKAVLDAERLPLGLAITIGLACARGLDYVHRAVDAQGQPLHLVHQDVSPANVLLSYEGDIKLSDFGVAWQGDAAQRGLEGKLGYMSPEAVQGLRLDARADQFALGVVLYEMVSGARAFWADDGSEAIMARVRSAQPLAPLSVAAPALAPGLRAVIERAMAVDPADRFDDVAQFAQALDQAAADVDRGPRLGPWLVARFPEADATDDAPIEVTAAASAPIVVPAHTSPQRPASRSLPEGTAAAIQAIVAEPSAPAPELSEPHRAGLVWALIAALVGVAAFVFWPQTPAMPDATVVDAAPRDATTVEVPKDARMPDARVKDARIVDAAPIVDAALALDARPPTAAPRSRAPRTRAPRSRAPRSRAPRSTTPRATPSIAIAPVTAPTTAAPPTTAPASVATLAPLTGPRIRARGARITAGQLLRDGWYRVFPGGAFVRFKGAGPSLSLRLKPQSGRVLATITSNPFAPLRVDSRPLGSTPAAVVPLSTGRHVIEVGVAPDVTRLTIEIGG